MASKDKRVDAYIAKSQPFAQPIMIKLRSLIHQACPDVTETMKWGMPSFDYQGPLFSFAAFKQHCVAGFWKYTLLKDPKGYLGTHKAQGGEAMGNLGRMTTLKDLPPDKAILNFVKQHMKLNELGIRPEKKKPAPKKVLVIPPELQKALRTNLDAKATFEKFPPSQKRDYADWIAEAKTEETRNRRLDTAIGWLEEGKPRNWKYMKNKKR